MVVPLRVDVDTSNWQNLIPTIDDIGYLLLEDIDSALNDSALEIAKAIRLEFELQDAEYTGTYRESIDIYVETDNNISTLTVDITPTGPEADEVLYYSKVLELGSGPGEEIAHWGGKPKLRQRLNMWARSKGIPKELINRVVNFTMEKFRLFGRYPQPILGKFFEIQPLGNGIEIVALNLKGAQIIERNLALAFRQFGFLPKRKARSGTGQLRNPKGQFTSKKLTDI